MTIEAQYTIEVLKAVIEEKAPKNPPENINWEEFYKFVVGHKVENMMYAAFCEIEEKIPQNVMAALGERNAMGIANEAIQALEFEALIDEFEKRGIKNLPLKGCILKYFYPMPDYRQSGDIDILIAEEDFEKVPPLMKELGYVEDEFDEYEHHIAYRRPGVLIEIHKKLVEDHNRASRYLTNVWDDVNVREGYSYSFEMSKEAMYTYIVAHMAKHIRQGGAGIRLVLDIWILLKLWNQYFDDEKLNVVLKEANLYEFNELAASLAKMWFGGEESNNKCVIALGEYVVDSGCYGTKENDKKIRASTVSDSKISKILYKLKKFFRSVFLPVCSMREEYPILNRYRFLLPAMWVRRIIKLLSEGRSAVSKRLSASLEIKDDAKELKEIWESVR